MDLKEKKKVPLEYQNAIKPIFRINLGSMSRKSGNKTVTINEHGTIFSPYLKSVASEMEKKIIECRNPLSIDEKSEISVDGFKGSWSNRSESTNWKGPIPLEDYPINKDPEPNVLRKKPDDRLIYNQDIKVRYLKPPKLPKPGDIVINVGPDRQIPPAPPIIIRQNRASIPDPPPLIIREAPPKPPQPISKKVINVPGKVIPPPARRVIVEKLPQAPQRPQSIILERWLPFEKQTRNVVYNKPQNFSILPDPKNLIIDWESPDIQIVRRIKNQGIFNTDPIKYSSKFKSELTTKFPKFAEQIPRPRGITLATEQNDYLPELIGDVEALKMVDLDRAGLSEYKDYLRQKFALNSKTDLVDEIAFNLFESLDKLKTGLVKVEDAHQVLFGLNKCFGKKFSENELKKYLKSLDQDFDDKLNFNQFSSAYFQCVF
ncbi:hypothetical protein BpHYR1_024240 [Brachionus plicatilis]|uniref:EF-hand domain-containing protein n=1 Tax=Brachionus plicatilis TaxID=10195 RepID=A0A3M7R8P0_BRAPC|nr:hypothetical protein BpHYR1_024240 [Brachionus plicatilis]